MLFVWVQGFSAANATSGIGSTCQSRSGAARTAVGVLATGASGARAASNTTDQPAAASVAPSASEHAANPMVVELQRINAEANELARHLRPDPVAVSTLERDLSKIRKRLSAPRDIDHVGHRLRPTNGFTSVASRLRSALREALESKFLEQECAVRIL
jgi:hypothetical protein